ncbi:CAP domain-containing protein [Salinimicrobium tongyeongense]|uniref:CAP domain-containing protein n=1 Tax=Salinimicrobium tongyeongense TaxID=2809707 RepID=A0ABY6NT98_9FLAO|nr:CAP domain-containing protein [Salinimicrobium tongyeongense]UZH55708.1 CAP domain-containing protein [Salinimicrobium tongyeongense]
MKNLTYFVWLMAVCTIYLTSCSKESVDEVDSANLSAKLAPVNYSSIELDVLELVNAYRQQQGLNSLLYLDEGSIEAAGHNQHMIKDNEVCHHFFGSRYQSLVKSVNAKAVSENVGFGYSTAEAVVKAWIKSDGHRENLEGDHTHFGISVKEGNDGKYYFTNIFVRK